MSTCYVNSEKRGFIEEKIYDVNFDVEQRINYLKSFSPKEIEKQTPEIIGDFILILIIFLLMYDNAPASICRVIF